MFLEQGSAEWRRFSDYLRVLARQAVSPRLRAKLDEADLVQEALMRAFQMQHQFRGETTADVLAWLRRILQNCICDWHRKFSRTKRNAARERSVREAVEGSSVNLDRLLACTEPTPSSQAIRKEFTVHLASILESLPVKQREALELHYLQGCTFSEVAERMGLSRDQAAGLIRRGLGKLKQLSDWSK
jgi:RNA polymerase sigma-70 factor (ECF subfamily)